jgi:hypothetical protein
MLGGEITLRNRVYYEELNRCFDYDPINVDINVSYPSVIVAGSNGRNVQGFRFE